MGEMVLYAIMQKKYTTNVAQKVRLNNPTFIKAFVVAGFLLSIVDLKPCAELLYQERYSVTQTNINAKYQ